MTGQTVVKEDRNAEPAPPRAIMVVHMRITDPGWMEDYFREVPPLLTAYGAVTLAASTRIVAVEGDGAPDRVAIFSFPSTAQAHAFLADPRYQAQRAARRTGSLADIVLFDDMTAPGRFV